MDKQGIHVQASRTTLCLFLDQRLGPKDHDYRGGCELMHSRHHKSKHNSKKATPDLGYRVVVRGSLPAGVGEALARAQVAGLLAEKRLTSGPFAT